MIDREPHAGSDDDARVAALHAYGILDTPREDRYDVICELAAAICDVPMAHIALVDAARQWSKASFGIAVRELPRDFSFCSIAIETPDVLTVVEDATADPRFAANPLVAQPNGIRFYAAAPLVTADGYAMGTLAILDRRPRTLSAEAARMLTLLASSVVAQFEFSRTVTTLDIFESAMNASEDAIAVFTVVAADPSGTPAFTYVNAAFEKLTGYGRAAIEDVHPFATLLGADSSDDALERIRLATRHGRAINVEVSLYRRDGSTFLAELSLSPVHDAMGAVSHYVSIIRDVTERRALAAEAVRAASLDVANASLTHEIEQRRIAEYRLRYAANHDDLTGLPNRAAFIEALDALFATRRNSAASGEELVQLFLDIDRFKYVNDSLGHARGDQLLVAIAGRLQDCVGDCGFVARLGGDEFTVFVAAPDALSRGIAAARAILDAFRVPFRLGSSDVFVNASIGIALCDETHLTPHDLLRDADTALYRAKDAGRGRYVVFTNDLREDAIARQRLDTDLRHAIGRDELWLAYQPIVALADGTVAGHEALVRWQHPEFGLMSPDRFIPLAEETGFVDVVGAWVLGAAMRAARAARNERSPHDWTMSVNVAAAQLGSGRLAADVAAALASSGVPPERLQLEITETAMMRSPAIAIETAKELRAMGVRIALDDFGSGYSSLGYLQQFPIDVVKIDRAFVSGGEGDGVRSPELVRAILAMSANLGLSVTAEGIETREQAETLRAFGCDHAQGYYFARPAATLERSVAGVVRTRAS